MVTFMRVASAWAKWKVKALSDLWRVMSTKACLRMGLNTERVKRNTRMARVRMKETFLTIRWKDKEFKLMETEIDLRVNFSQI